MGFATLGKPGRVVEKRGDTLVAAMKDRPPKPPPKQPDYYFENGLLVYTAAFHRKRGSCCGSGCRHCPFLPPHLKGNTVAGNTKTG